MEFILRLQKQLLSCEACRIRLTPQRAVAAISTLVSLYSLARVGVLFLEAFAVVREERSQDSELLELCTRGDARASPKMREACLQARAERASPLIAKAILYAVSTAFKDFAASVGSPFKFSIFIFFIFTSVVFPLMPWIRTALGMRRQNTSNRYDDDDDAYPHPHSHFIVMAPSSSSYSRRSQLKRALGRHIPMLRNKPRFDEQFIEGGEQFNGQFEEFSPSYTSYTSNSSNQPNSSNSSHEHGD